MSKLNKFLPTTKEEMKQRGWDELDVVLITQKEIELPTKKSYQFLLK